MYSLNILIHVLWDIVFVLVCLYNPGIAPRNPEIHNTEYLKKIAQKNQIYLICKDCKIINRECSDGIVIHCFKCGVCIESHESHY